MIHYSPDARPGHRAPHLWLERGDEQVSTIDLIGYGQFTLFTTPECTKWHSAFMLAIGDRQLQGRAWTVGAGGDLHDPTGRFRELYGLMRGGAVMVRPDGYVAFRTADLNAKPPDILNEVFDIALGRQPGQRAFLQKTGS